MEDLLTKREAAAFLDVSEKTLDRRVKEGIIRPIRFSERIVKYSRRELQAYIDQKSAGIAANMTPAEAEKIVRNVLEAHNFDQETTEALAEVANLLATLRS